MLNIKNQYKLINKIAYFLDFLLSFPCLLTA
jgi:hypothetical protein